ncbi:MAG: glycosyltransferase family 2 protein [Lachnospiraceae bacterium]|nr:glycosyltransferase family 2 protein [Lachnospiraceae bacterium]
MRSGLLSVIIPAFNEQGNIERTFGAVSGILSENGILYEIIFVDDGSSDDTFLKIKELSDTHPEIVGLSFSRNFGKEAAIFAGLETAKGDCAVLMDCDLQHPAETLPEMYQLWSEGFEVVEGIKTSRGKENPAHGFAAGTFYKIMSRATGIDMARASDFKLLDRKAVDALLLMPERAPFFRALSSWIGFKKTEVFFEVNEREIGTSKWSVLKLTRYAIQNITSFSSAPMQFVTIMGIVFLIFSIAIAAESLYKYFTGQALEGFTTVILLQLITGGVLMLGIGIIGHYISRIYEEIKARPRYIIRRRIGGNK